MPMRRGKARQGPLALGGEEAVGLQLRLQLLERLVERAQARLADLLDRELVGAARLVEGDASTHFHLLSVLRPELQELCAAAIHDALDLGVGVLQAEIPVPGRHVLHPGELAPHPESLELVFQQDAHPPVEVGDLDYDGCRREQGTIGRLNRLA
jgi:hypothetical protein